MGRSKYICIECARGLKRFFLVSAGPPNCAGDYPQVHLGGRVFHHDLRRVPSDVTIALPKIGSFQEGTRTQPESQLTRVLIVRVSTVPREVHNPPPESWGCPTFSEV